MNEIMYSAFVDEMVKIAGSKLENAIELAGLGTLAVPGADSLQAAARAKMKGDSSSDKYRLMGDTAHAGADVAGLAMLMGPEIRSLLKKAMAVSGGLFGAAEGALAPRAAVLATRGRGAVPAVIRGSVSKTAPVPSLAALTGKTGPSIAGLVPPRAPNMFGRPAVDMTAGYTGSPQFMADLVR